MQNIFTDIEDFIHGNILSTILAAVCIIVVTILLAHFVTRFMKRIFMRKDESGNDRVPSGSIFINIARVVIWVLGLSVLLSTCFGINISAAIAALGVGGIAVSLGFQDTLSNLIAGLEISLTRVVSRGDNIEVNGMRGVVQDITWRHTSIKDDQDNIIVIPNSAINKTALVKAPPQTTVQLSFTITNKNEPLDELVERIRDAAEAAAKSVCSIEEPPVVTLSGIDGEGFVGSIKIVFSDEEHLAEAKNAVICAIAPIAHADYHGHKHRV